MPTRNSKTMTAPQGPDTRQTKGRDGRRVEAAPGGLPPGHRPGGDESGPGRRRLTPLVWLAATVAVIAIIALVAAVTATSEQGATTGENVTSSVEPTVGSQEYLARLANQGYIPKEAVNQDLLRRELENGVESPEPPFESGSHDRLLEDLANQGRIPPEAAR
jgi:hypothetical protein